MTFLGKVPKPINLPSQRLENHGLDPNVEFVPKGTFTWGSRASSATTNAWGSSSVSSPLADGSAGSPSFASGCPSSGGSGTHPSTAGSDRSHEPVSNVWSPNSCPSSASGILASSQISSAVARPQSSETRPGSSQLSRFAESSVDNPVAWGPTGTAERLGFMSSKTSGFTLSSGDFPTLGSEKNSDSHSQRGHSSQGHPSSASGTASTPKETPEPNLADHQDNQNVDTWKAENHPYVGDRARPYMENWHKDPQQAHSYANVNIPPRQFDSWHNPQLHPADGAWYRGGEPVGLYRPPGSPGNFFDYPRVPAGPLPNAQALPRPEARSVGYRLNNGEHYRPHMPPEHYVGPGHSYIPLRPGPYPVTLPYEGYYGPPQTGFYNPSEKGPVISMVQPAVYNQYPIQNPNLDPGKYHIRPGGHAATMNEEQMKSDQVHERQGQFRVLLKQHGGWEDHEAQGKGEQSVMATTPHHERRNQPRLVRHEGDWRTKEKPIPAEAVSLPTGEEAPIPRTSSLDGHSSETYVRKHSIKAADGGLIRREETTNSRVCDRNYNPVMKKRSTLMEKGEGLNTKTRVTDGQSEFQMNSSKERTESKDATIISDQSTSMVNVLTFSKAVLVHSNPDAFTEEKNRESISNEKVLHAPSAPIGTNEDAHFQGQKRVHGAKGIDRHAKSRSSSHGNDAKRIPGSESSKITVLSGEGGHDIRVLDCAATLEAPENHGVPHVPTSSDGSCSASSLDTIDRKVQLTKIKERARQRARQLQEEEEQERIREQKAKALAKLEEFNRRTSAESSNQKFSHFPPPTNDVLNNKQGPGAGAVPKADITSLEASSGTLACESEAVIHTDDNVIRSTGDLIIVSSNLSARTSDSAIRTSDLPQNQSLAPCQETISKEVIPGAASDIRDTSSKHKQLGYRRRQDVPQDKIMGEKQPSSISTGGSTYTGDVATNISTSEPLTNNEDDSVHHKKKNNKSAKSNRNKLDEALPNYTCFSADTEGISQKLHPGSRKNKSSFSATAAVSAHFDSFAETVASTEASSVQSSREVLGIPLDQELTIVTEESHTRISNQWKPHAHRKLAKSQQANKPVSKYLGGTEAVIWAPVKPPNKNEPSVEVSKNSLIEATNPSGKSVHDMSSVMKTKRAEMERYVPKPVAKELSQQVSSQQDSPSCTQGRSGDMSGKPDSVMPTVECARPDGITIGKARIASDTKDRENIKHSKHGKISASWCQRSSDESPSIEGSLSLEPAKSVQKASDLQPSMVDTALKGELKQTNDGCNDISDSLPPSASVASTAALKDVGANRQRRQPYRVQRAPGSIYPTKNTGAYGGITDRSEIQPQNDSDDGEVMKNESQKAIGDNTKPHWQPKSQTKKNHVRQGNRVSGGLQRVSAQDRENDAVQNEHDNGLNPRTVATEARVARHQEFKRERKVVADPSKEDISVELTPLDVNPQHQQHKNLGANQPGHYNNNFQRGQDSGYRGKGLGQDVGKQNYHIDGEKGKSSTNLGYQQVVSHHNKPGEQYEQNPAFGGGGGGAREGSRAPGYRYRERGRHHPVGGANFYGRGVGASGVSVRDSNNSGE